MNNYKIISSQILCDALDVKDNAIYEAKIKCEWFEEVLLDNTETLHKIIFVGFTDKDSHFPGEYKWTDTGIPYMETDVIADKNFKLFELHEDGSETMILKHRC